MTDSPRIGNGRAVFPLGAIDNLHRAEYEPDMNRLLAYLAGLLLIGLASCQKKSSAPPPPPPRVTVTPIAQENVLVMNTWVGLLNGYQNAEIRAQVTGYLMSQDYK
ncbi:MAG TPA: hypothetical protein VFI76_08710, partial [Terrimicrobiaceae bacterium]|nr:hypothetical protein [Terrimicrobiaceae bacterium]